MIDTTIYIDYTLCPSCVTRINIDSLPYLRYYFTIDYMSLIIGVIAYLPCNLINVAPGSSLNSLSDKKLFSIHVFKLYLCSSGWALRRYITSNTHLNFMQWFSNTNFHQIYLTSTWIYRQLKIQKTYINLIFINSEMNIWWHNEIIRN